MLLFVKNPLNPVKRASRVVSPESQPDPMAMNSEVSVF